MFSPPSYCSCGGCNADCFKKFAEIQLNEIQLKDLIFRFLNGPNHTFSGLRSQILLMKDTTLFFVRNYKDLICPILVLSLSHLLWQHFLI